MKYNFNLKFEYLFALFSLPIFLYAQNPINSIEFSPQMSLSSFSAQDNKMSGIAIGGELIYHFNTSASPKEWVKMLKLNSIDIVFNYKNMNNITRVTQPISHEFGNSYAVLGALNLPLITSKKLALNFSPGFGLLYVNKTWFTNQNPVIGSHINFASRASLKLIAPINSSAKISAGLDILHYSNAGIRVPNNGMNISSLSLGLIKQFKPIQKEKIDSNSNIKYKNSKKSNLYLSAATGLAYFDKAGLVNENVVLGSKLNYSTKFQFRAERSISSSAWLSLVIAFYHLSNGGIRIPNKGLNVMSTGLGFKQYLITKPSNQISETVSAKLEKYNKLHSFDIGATIGATGMYAKNKFLHKVDLYAGYNYRLSNMLGLSIGADAIYNFTAYDVNRHYETYQGFASSTNNWRGGLGVGPDIWLGNFAVMAKMGYYLYIKPGEDRKPTYVYNTIGFKYHFVNSFALQTKVHLSKTEAEFVGFGIIFSK